VTKRLEQILNWAINNKYSDFYRSKYKGVDLADFENIPFLTRDEILKTPPYERCFVDRDKVIGVLSSSGTTKYGPLVIPQELRIQEYRGRRVVIYDEVFFKRLRRRGGKNIMALGTSILFNRVNIVPKKDIFLVTADIANLALAADIARNTQIDAIWTNPSSLYFFIPYLMKKYDLSKILFVSLASEFCSKEKLKFFRKRFPNATFSFIYGSAEAATVGWQCDVLSNSTPVMYHFFDYVYPEIIDSETGKNIPNGKFGELVLTATDKRAFVPIRYRTGDRARILTKKCKCKDPGLLFEMGGRIGMDDVTIQGAKIVRSEMEKVLSDISGIEMDFRMHIYEKHINSRFYYYFRLDLTGDKTLYGDSDEEAKISRKIESELKVSPRLKFLDLVKRDVFLPLEVRIVRSLPRELKRKNFILHY